MVSASSILGSAGSGASIGGSIGGPWGAGIGAAVGAGAGALGSIHAGQHAANNFVQNYEDVLGKQILPQVVKLRDAGQTQAAQQLLQQGLQQYYQGVTQFQGQGGVNAKVAGQSIANKPLQDTISSIASSMGMQYAPGSGLVNGGAAAPGSTGPNGAFDPAAQAAKGALYGLQAPLQQGDPFALNPNGYDPKTQANMRATAMEAPAQAGQQQMAQAKRSLSQNGIWGSPAAAALQGTVARQTGYQQNQNLRDVQTQNAQVGLQNQQANFGELNNRYGQATRALTGFSPMGG